MTVRASSVSSSQDSTRSRILSEAAQLFLARGYHGVSMREVAAAVGVTKPALYHHYEDKEMLFMAMLENTLGGLSELVARAEAQLGIRSQLETLVGELLATASDQRIGMQLAGELRHVSLERRQHFEANYRQIWMGGISRLLDEGVRRGELRTDLPTPELMRALLGLLYPLVNGRPPAQPYETARAALSIFLDGAAPR